MNALRYLGGLFVKTSMKILAAIIVALAVFIPLSMSDSDEAVVTDTSEFETIGELAEGEIGGVIDSDRTYTDEMTIVAPVTIEKNITLTFSSGSSLDLGFMVGMKPISITGSEGSTSLLKEGSTLIVAGEELPISDDTEIGINGKISYGISGVLPSKLPMNVTFQINASVDAGTVISVNEIPIKFAEETKFYAEVAITLNEMPTDSDISKLDAKVSVNATLTAGKISLGAATLDSAKLTFKGDVTTPKNNKTEFFVGTVSMSSDASVTVYDEENMISPITIVLKSELKDGKLEIKGFEDLISDGFSFENLKKVVLNLNGEASGSITVKKIDINDESYIENLKLSAEASIKDKVAKQEVALSIGKFVGVLSPEEGSKVNVSVSDIKLAEASSIDLSKFSFGDFLDFVEVKIMPIIGPIFSPEESDDDDDAYYGLIGQEITGRAPITIPEGIEEAVLELAEEDDEGVDPEVIMELVMEALVLIKDVKAELGVTLSVGEFVLDGVGTEGQKIDISGKGISIGPKIGYDQGPDMSYVMKVDSLKVNMNVGFILNAELKGFKAEVKIDTTLSEEKIEGEITAAIDVESLDLKYIDRGNAAYVSLSKFHIGAELSLKDNDLKASASITGSANVKIFESNAIVAEISVKDAKLGASYDFGEFNIMAPEIPEFDPSKLEIESLSAGIKVTTQGITIEITKINVNLEDMILTADKVTLDGVAAYSEDVASVKATLNGVKMPLGEGSLPAIQSGEITIVMANGAKIVDKFEFKDGVANENITVSGGDVYYYEALPVEMIEVMKYGMEWNLKVSGKGKLIFDEVYTEQMNLQGTVYALEYIETADEAHDISIRDEYGAYAGFVSITDNDAKKMKVVAATGYELVESSYSGFKVGKNGYIEVDEPDSVISATCSGEEYTVKFDNGKSFKTEYGKPIDMEVDPDVIYVLDSDGEEFGTVSGGFWSVGKYDVPKNINLRLVKAETIEPIPDKEFESDSDDIFFESPAVGQKVIVKTPSKMKFVVEGKHGAFTDGVKITNKETKFDGKKAFEITANGDVVAKFPVKNDKVTVSHVINGAPLEMTGTYEVDEKGQTYLVVPLESYSTYVLSTSSGSSGSDDGGISGVTIAIIAIVVLLVAGGVAFFVIKNKKTSA